jgi:DNA repair protein RecO (recombination protein O)
MKKTKGVVLKRFPYSESSFIIHLYTSEYGKKSFIVSGVRGKRAKYKTNLFEPLQIVDVVFYEGKSSISRITEIAAIEFIHDISTDIIKRSCAFFLCDILYYSLKTEHSDFTLFTFIKNSILILENNENISANFHIVFLVNLSKYLGFFPQNNHSQNNRFYNIEQGQFSDTPQSKSLNEELSEFLKNSLSVNFSNMMDYKLKKNERKMLIKIWVEIYSFHIPNFNVSDSLIVLETIFE